MSPRKVLTAAQMRAVDQRTSELGIPGIVLMENAASRVVEFLTERCAPLSEQRIVVYCGKGNNGGDGLGVARQLLTRFQPRSFDVILAANAEELSGDAAANYRMFAACGGKVAFEPEPRMQAATLIIDGVLGSGITGPARGQALDAIRQINTGFPSAQVVAVDVPSGMPSDTGDPVGEFARADATVTFTAPRTCHILPPNCRHIGRLRVAPIGTPPALYQDDPTIQLALVEPLVFRALLGPRDPGGNKGNYGHVLVLAGSRGKTGAAGMSGLAALRAGAGLVTVASAQSAVPVIAGFAPELMTESLAETEEGTLADAALEKLTELAEARTVVAMGPGLGAAEPTARVVRELYRSYDKPMVVDADALNILAAGTWPKASGKIRVLTPHPGEMARLTHTTVQGVQSDRVGCARSFAKTRDVILVLKGERTLVAFPDGMVWVNPPGSPSMATGGTGDILTGMIAGMIAQQPGQVPEAVAGGVWLHGRSGELGALEFGEQVMIATDLLKMLPGAMADAKREDSELYKPFGW
jgi:NAD(P)H-hydrate epimerase